MSYCRFENTYGDLMDCARTIERIENYGEEISKREWEYAKKLKSWCEIYLEVFEDLDEEDVDIVE